MFLPLYGAGTVLLVHLCPSLTVHTKLFHHLATFSPLKTHKTKVIKQKQHYRPRQYLLYMTQSFDLLTVSKTYKTLP